MKYGGFGMKKVKYFLLVFVLGLTCFSPLALTGCGKKLNWNGLSIVGFENFVGIGAVSFEDEKIAHADEGGVPHKMKLAGFKADEMCEEIRFENEKGKISKQDAHLLHFDAYENCTLVSFTTDKKQDFINYDSCDYTFYSSNDFTIHDSTSYGYINKTFHPKNSFFFIIDNISGKIYDMRDVVKGIEKVCNIKDFRFGISGFPGFDGFGTTGYSLNNNNFLMMFITENTNNSETRSYVCQLSFENNNVKVTLRMNNIQSKNFTSMTGYVKTDRFGHMFSVMDLYYSLQIFRCQKPDGLFLELDNDAIYKLGINSILYMQNDNSTYYLNEDSQFVEIDFDFDAIVTRVDNLHFYDGAAYGSNSSNLLKFVFDKQHVWKYVSESIALPVGGTMVGSDNRIYILNDKSIYVYDIDVNTTTKIDSKYEFKNMTYNKNYDQVKFKAVDTSTLLEVDGYFTEEGEIVIGDFEGLKSGLNRVFIVKPLN